MIVENISLGVFFTSNISLLFFSKRFGVLNSIRAVIAFKVFLKRG